MRVKAPQWVLALEAQGITFEEFKAARATFAAHGCTFGYVTNYREFWLSAIGGTGASCHHIRLRLGVEAVGPVIADPLAYVAELRDKQAILETHNAT